jgi:hypothetical protein
VWAGNVDDLYTIGTMHTYMAHVFARDDGHRVAAREDPAVESGDESISHSLSGADPPAEPLHAANFVDLLDACHEEFDGTCDDTCIFAEWFHLPDDRESVECLNPAGLVPADKQGQPSR